MPDHRWLPELLTYAGEDDLTDVEPAPDYLDLLYAAYVRDFVDSQPRFHGLQVRRKRYPEFRGKCGTFWHVVSEGDDIRGFRLSRAERIRWPRRMIEETAAPEGSRVRVWSTERGNDTRWVVALEDFSYVVVLAQRNGYYILWTAYPVERARRRETFRREWASQIAGPKS